MGILETRWEALYEGHKLTVFRNEVTKGFTLEWDGSEIARRSWSWVGLGELKGTAEHNGEPVEVHVTIDWAGLGQLDGKCTLSVGGKEIAVTRVR